ncbi:OLC1v1008229C1 [Oldenlandia corymbosa var. corymbosa]|uniref:chitinase n=1 Tax=Oldenlandia corymbosa var. corymbosa TaxID=529605 RepID=A0AAV1DL30_OLDCO|nr:OLC1v1008229C1 [Oldenlandia corymbosa var. corymbosa]
MEAKNSSLALIFSILVLVVAASFPQLISGQNCGCNGLCCSKWGYCGMGDPYCGDGCREGPCYSSSGGGSSGGGSSGGGSSVSDIVSDAFFNGIANQAGSGCEGRGFYTRSAFLNAANSYSGFGTTGSTDDAKREIAAFFAHVTHETGHFCYINEINGASQNYCDDKNFPQYPCVQGKGYYGRGPLQLSWNYNYAAAGNSIGFDGLGNPDIVAQDNVISFKTGLWFWMNNCHSVINSQGFGATIQAINGRIECNGGNSGAVNARVGYYQDYCRQLGVDPGANLYC